MLFFEIIGFLLFLLFILGVRRTRTRCSTCTHFRWSHGHSERNWGLFRYSRHYYCEQCTPQESNSRKTYNGRDWNSDEHCWNGISAWTGLPEEAGVPTPEFQVLYGLGEPVRKALVAEGLDVRVYVPLGDSILPAE